MRILVSACLLGENCKYDGGNNLDEELKTYLKDKEVIPICPEVMGGLPIPRIPSEIRNGIVVVRGKMILPPCGKEFFLHTVSRFFFAQ